MTNGEYEEPTREGYIFEGWFEDEEFNVEFTGVPEELSLLEDKTVYAKWKEILPTTKYAVQIYGIGQDENQNGEKMGLTFGPALGQDFMNTYISHTPSGLTEDGNEHRCVHDDTWEEIVYWNNVDPYVYEQCVGNNCTHSVKLTFPDYLKEPSFVYGGSDSGDGVGKLLYEFNNYCHRTWNPINNDAEFGTNKDGWGASRIRAMMNSYDELTMLKGLYSYYNSSFESVPETNYTPGNTLIDAFPQILQNNIGARKTLYDSVCNERTEANLKVTYDKLWLLSSNEMSNSISYHPLEAPNGKYQRFVYNNLDLSYSDNNAFRAFNQSSPTSTSGANVSSISWWLRSSDTAPDSILVIYGRGGVSDTGATSSGSGVSPCFSLDTTYKFPRPVTTKYAVQIYGIGQDIDENNETMGLTFGPALGQDFMNTYISHTPSGNTALGNVHRCVHNDTWEEIINWNNVDPYVYEQCVAENCTHSVELRIGDDLKNPDFVYGGSSSGDGVGTLFYELLEDGKFQHIEWNPLQSSDSTQYGTNYGGWGASRIRAMMNGADSLTTTGVNYGTSVTSYLSPIMAATDYTVSDALLSAFPAVLQNAIGARATLYDSVYNDKTIANLKTSYDKLWLLSPNEMSNEPFNSNTAFNDYYNHPLEAPNGKYQKFVENNINLSTSSNTAFIAYKQNGNTATSSTDSSWWIRSSSSRSADYVLYVSNSGRVNDSFASGGYSVSPCFSLARQNNTSSANRNKADGLSNLLADYGTETAELKTTDTKDQIISNQNANAFSFDMHNISEKLSSVFSFNNIVHAEDTEITFENGEAEFTLKANEKITFKDIPAGTAYQVWEETPDGWIIYEQKHTSGEIMPLETSEAEITNRYQPGTTSVQFNGSKTLDNVAAAEGSFQFELLENGTVLQTVGVLDGGFIQFAPITYDSAGTHNYIIQEVDPNNDKLDWDIHKENIRVVITDDGNGNLSSEVTYDEDGIVFRNNTRPGTLEIKKNVDISTNANKDDVFTFEIEFTNENGVPLSGDENIYWYKKDANGNIIDDVNLLGKIQAFFTGKDTKLNSSPIGQEGFDNENNTNNEENTSAVNEEGLLERLGLVKRIFAEEGDIASGIYDNVDWRITSSGELIIGKEGEVQEFAYRSSRNDYDYPWYSRRDSINSVRFAGTVKGNGSMAYMFFASKATTLDLSSFNTSNVTNMQNMFRSSQATLTIFPENFGSAATNMDYMFYGSKATSLDLSNFNTSNVTRMLNMFYSSKAISIIFPENFGSAATDMHGMFSNSQATTLDLSSFNTSKVVDMAFMFSESQATSLNLSSFDTSKVTNMEHMFYRSKATSLDLSSFNTSSVTDMSYMFCASMATSLNLNSFDTSNVTNMSYMFNGSQATSLDLSSFNTSKVTDMNHMFWNSKATLLDLSSFNTSNVTDMNHMFSGSKATTLDLSSFNTSSVTDMGNMFSSVEATSLDLSSFNTSNVTNMSAMFSYSRATSLDLSSFNTSKVTNMSAMFNWSRATTLDLSSFDTSKVTRMDYMFSSSKATSLDLSSFDTSKVTSANSMFDSTQIEEISIGEDFFSSSFNSFPDAISDTTNYYTGKWVESNGSFGPYTTYQIKLYKNIIGTWILDVSHINFDANGGYILPEYRTVYSNKSLNGVLVPGENAIHRSYYKFKGWSKTTQGTTISYQPGSVAPNSYAKNSPTLYAVWEYDGKNQINVNHYQKTTDDTDYNLVETEVIRDIPGIEYSPELKSYPGFYAVSQVETVIVDDEDLVNVNYYYDRNKYTINFNGNNSSSGQISPISALGAFSITLPKNTFGKKGAIFTGWNTQPNGSGTTYLDQAEVLNLGNHNETVTLYAQWSTNDNSVAPSNGKILVQCKAGESIVIPDLPYGTKYTIKEVNLPEGWSFDSSTGEIGSVDANAVSSSQFNNKYLAEGLAFITAHKTIIGDTPQEGQFTFELYQGNTLLQSKTNEIIDTNEEIPGKNDENIPNPWVNTAPIEFDSLQFTQEDIGKTFTYTIKEVNSGDNRINYDTHSETVTITVNDAGNGNLDCNVVYDSNGALFTNSLKSSSLQLKKNIVNQTQASEETEFNFRINLKDSAGNPISGEYPVKIKEKDYGFYDYEVPAIKYSHTNNIDDAGNRSGGFGTSQRLKDIVTIPGATTLHVEVQYGTYSSGTGYGRLYVVPGEYTGTISTSLPTGYVGYLYGYTSPYRTMNYDIESDTVTFGFYSGTNSYNNNTTQAYSYGYYAVITPYDEDGNILTKIKTREEGFSETTISDGGTLTLKGGEELEITGLPDGATYEIVELDSPGWEITNKAGETGQIIAGETAFVEFENTYSSSGKVILSGNKMLYGSSLENESFEFELKDENDNVLQTVTSDPQGNFSFEIDYSQEDDGNTFYYHITEKIDEERENIKWDEHIAEVSAKIEDNGQGELIPTVTLNEEDMTFTNVFYNSIEVSKLVTGEFGDKSKEFNFTLKLSENWDKNEITWTKGEETGVVDSNNFRFTLSHDDSITFEGITSNIEYEVVENDSFKNGYSSKVEGDMESSSVNPLNMELSAKGNLDSDKSITFTNDARGVIPTEIRLRDSLFALSAILVAAIFFVARKRRKYVSE